MKKTLLLIIFAGILIQGVQANGLQLIENTSTISIEKIVGQDKQVRLVLENQEPFEFKNIRFEENPHITMSQISSLGSGQRAEFNATISGNIDFSGQIRLRGFYEDNIGNQNPKTYDANLTYNSQTDDYHLDLCDTTITKGDSIRWNNKAPSTINLRRDNGTPIGGSEMPPNGTFTRTFTEAGSFNYYVAIVSFPITPVCHVTILNDTGLINDPQLDAILNLNLDVSHNPTNISLNAPKTSYTIEANTEKESVIFITNNGEAEAVNVVLFDDSGWFKDFSRNNINIAPQDTAIITFKINPLIFNTNDTGKNYTKSLKVSGNFETISQDFQISVPFKQINFGSGGFFGSNKTIEEIIRDLVLAFCPGNPNVDFCQRFNRNSTDGNPSINFNLTSEQTLDLVRSIVELEQRQRIDSNYLKDTLDEFFARLNVSESETTLIKNDLERIRENDESYRTGMLIFLITLVFLAILGISITGTLFFRKKIKERKLERFTADE